MDLNVFRQQPLLGILRGIESKHVEPLVEAVINSGLRTIEITMNTPHAARLIEQIHLLGKSHLTIGAGTVLTIDDVRAALDAGASFVVMPTLVEGVVEECRRKKVPVFPGALTPQEIYRAWQAGATMVKVFPARFFGPEYFRELKGPFHDIELLACSGVTPGNLKEYFANGASAVAFGSSVFKKEWLETGHFQNIEQLLSLYIQEYERMRPGRNVL